MVRGDYEHSHDSFAAFFLSLRQHIDISFSLRVRCRVFDLYAFVGEHLCENALYSF